MTSRRGLIQFHGGIVMRCRAAAAAGQPPVFRPVWGNLKRNPIYTAEFMYENWHLRLDLNKKVGTAAAAGGTVGLFRISEPDDSRVGLTVRRFC